MTINVLGTNYELEIDDLNRRDLGMNDGVCFVYDKRIVVREPKYMDGGDDRSKVGRFRHVIRHELIHAFAMESGVPYGDDEQLVDWIAAMLPKIAATARAIEERMKVELLSENRETDKNAI